MTREQAWETVRGTLNDYVPAGDDHFEASQALFFLRTEMERLEGERDEGWDKRDEAWAKYADAMARIAELEAALRRKNRFIERVANMNPTSGELTLAIRIELQREARAALPDTEGPEELRPVRPGPHIAAMPWSNERTDAWRPDTEGEQDGL